MNKEKLRRLMIEKRLAMNVDDVAKKSSRISQHFFQSSHYKNSTSIMTYVSFKNEVDTHSIIKKMIEDNKTVSVPYCIPNTRLLSACHIETMDDLEKGFYGLLEPKDTNKIVNPKDIDIVLVPGVVFDKNKNRIGHGAGYYDRFLSSLDTKTLKIALAYYYQIVDLLPTEKHDIPMDYIITESGII